MSQSESRPEFIAQQLRKPSGSFAPEIGENMNRVNKPLYDLTLDVMELQENDSILDGFGTGKFFNKLFARAEGLQVSGIDFSEAMVKVAKKHNSGAISSGKLNIKQASSEEIPFPDELFDKVFCNMVIYFWDQPENHLREVRRMLKPGGKFYTGIRTRESMRVFPFVEYGFSLYSTKEWKEILNQSGFLVVEVHKRLDSEIEFESNKLRLESCCIIVKKAEY